MSSITAPGAHHRPKPAQNDKHPPHPVTKETVTKVRVAMLRSRLGDPSLAAVASHTSPVSRVSRRRTRGQEPLEELETVNQQLDPTTAPELAPVKQRRRIELTEASSLRDDLPAAEDGSPAIDTDVIDTIDASSGSMPAAGAALQAAGAELADAAQSSLTSKSFQERSLDLFGVEFGPALPLSEDDRSRFGPAAAKIDNGIALLVSDGVNFTLNTHGERLQKTLALREKMLGLLAADAVKRELPSLANAAAAGKRLQTQVASVAKAEAKYRKAANEKARSALKAAELLPPEEAASKQISSPVSATIDMLLDIIELRAKEISPWPKDEPRKPLQLVAPVNAQALVPAPANTQALVLAPVPAPAAPAAAPFEVGAPRHTHQSHAEATSGSCPKDQLGPTMYHYYESTITECFEDNERIANTIKERNAELVELMKERDAALDKCDQAEAVIRGLQRVVSTLHDGWQDAVDVAREYGWTPPQGGSDEPALIDYGPFASVADYDNDELAQCFPLGGGWRLPDYECLHE